MNRDIKLALVWAAAMIGAALAAAAVSKAGYIDAEAVVRVNSVVIGLYLVWLGNRMPKTVAPNACALQVARVGGWSTTLSGIVYTALWAFAPLSMAVSLGSVAVVAGVAIPLGYCLWLRGKARAA